MQNGKSRASLLPSQGPPTGGKVPITDRQDIKKHQITQDTLPVLSCLLDLQQATLAQLFPANDAAAYLYVVRATLSEGLLMTVNQLLSKFNVSSLLSQDVQHTVLECLLWYHKAKLLEDTYTMQLKRAEQLRVCGFW